MQPKLSWELLSELAVVAKNQSASVSAAAYSVGNAQFLGITLDPFDAQATESQDSERSTGMQLMPTSST